MAARGRSRSEFAARSNRRRDITRGVARSERDVAPGADSGQNTALPYEMRDDVECLTDSAAAGPPAIRARRAAEALHLSARGHSPRDVLYCNVGSACPKLYGFVTRYTEKCR